MYASNCADTKRILDNKCPALFIKKAISPTNSFLKNIIASAAKHPFLVAPNDNTSTPDFQVISAGVAPKDTNALANLAPSICKFRLCL